MKKKKKIKFDRDIKTHLSTKWLITMEFYLWYEIFCIKNLICEVGKETFNKEIYNIK